MFNRKVTVHYHVPCMCITFSADYPDMTLKVDCVNKTERTAAVLAEAFWGRAEKATE